MISLLKKLWRRHISATFAEVHPNLNTNCADCDAPSSDECKTCPFKDKDYFPREPTVDSIDEVIPESNIFVGVDIQAALYRIERCINHLGEKEVNLEYLKATLYMAHCCLRRSLL